MYCCWVCCSIWQHGKDLYDTKKVPSTSYIIIFLFVVQLLDIYNEEHLVKCLHSLIYYCFAFTRVEFSWKHIFFWKSCETAFLLTNWWSKKKPPQHKSFNWGVNHTSEYFPEKKGFRHSIWQIDTNHHWFPSAQKKKA